MSSNERDVASMKAAGGRGPARPFWIGIGLVVFGAVWIHGGLGLPQGARYAAVGPGLFPTLIGAGIVLLGVILTVQIWRGETFEAQDSEDAAASAPMDRRAFLTALAAVVLPVFAIDALGLPVTAALSFALVARSLGSRRSAMDLAIGALVGTLSWYLFTRLGLQLGGFLPLLGV